MITHDRIKLFVRNTLGCGCPEEVFRTIECVPGVCLRDDIKLDAVLTIGNRLLIYVFTPAIHGEIEQQLAFLVSTGKRERDARGLNRFRLVIVTDKGEERLFLKRKFEMLTDKDEKVHLHMLSWKETIFRKAR